MGQKAPDCVVMNVTVRSMKLHGGAFGDRAGRRPSEGSGENVEAMLDGARTSTATSATCPDSACRSSSPSTASRATRTLNLSRPMRHGQVAHTTSLDRGPHEEEKAALHLRRR